MIRNNKGVTLIELLGVLALLSMILLLATSVHIFGHKQISNQTSHISNQTNVRLAINILSKEIRKANSIEVSNNVLTINGTDTYSLANNEIKKNQITLVTSINGLNVTKSENKISITITSMPDKNNQDVTLSTEIYIRE